MNTKAKNDVKQNVIYVTLSVLIVLIIYVIFQCVMLLRKPTNSMIVKNGRLTNYEEVVGLKKSWLENFISKFTK